MVCLNCMDGRVQIPVIHWIQQTYDADYVDMITAPGMDGILAGPKCSLTGILENITISIQKNNALKIFIVGHHDCRGNPGTESEHYAQIRQGVARICKEFLDYDVIGLWVNARWQVSEIASGKSLSDRSSRIR